MCGPPAATFLPRNFLTLTRIGILPNRHEYNHKWEKAKTKKEIQNLLKEKREFEGTETINKQNPEVQMYKNNRIVG